MRDLTRQSLYESMVTDTPKVRFTWFMWALPVALVVLGVLLWRVWAFFNPEKLNPPRAGGSRHVESGSEQVPVAE